ncbi:CCR4-NOT transcription complex [Cryptosporidium sp. chipmunk genotype I]|uniref:CCR4-NOT transcription complex n=1 Tax=Cryptosporidium sp. chipmunk genotype I TaxID=1280935 RepID=UPI00351A9EA6|nr:CCR4-NOT transcription complex [Cryptosporidium sp. chipmunk genotype I]
MDATKQVQKSSSSSCDQEDTSPQESIINSLNQSNQQTSTQKNADKNLDLEDILYETSQQAISYNRTNYGLLGILNVIRMTDSDLNILALGTDLTTLGLNLNSSECLYLNFDSPWSSNKSAQPESETNEIIQAFANTPNNVSQIIGLKSTYVQKFALETLFYIFYNMPQDLLQGFAAVELCNRGWLYYPESFKWYSKVQNEENQTTEWQVFDTEKWCKVPISEPPSSNLLSIDEIRPSVEEGVRIHSKWIQEQNQIYQIVQQQMQQQSNSRNKGPESQVNSSMSSISDFSSAFNQRNVQHSFPQTGNSQAINSNNYSNFKSSNRHNSSF